MVPMIIKGLFRRYERWNPVHPTMGAFWGMGIGVGCGVGWGPGFGPEVIGYVGAGCGVGFSVGLTLAGVGIGLPSNHLIQVPSSAFTGSTGALEITSSKILMPMRSVAGSGWSLVAPHVSSFRKGTCQKISSFKTHIPLAQEQLKHAVSLHITSPLGFLEAFRDQWRRRGKDT